MPLSPVVVLLQGIPETLVLVYFVYVLLGARIRPLRILALGLSGVGVLSAVRFVGALLALWVRRRGSPILYQGVAAR